MNDEAQLLPLWNRVHAGYGGFVARTAEHWRWSVRQLRGVADADILIGESAGVVRSYGALAANGTVVEFAVDTQLKRRDRKRACVQLIEGLEHRARVKGCASIDFAAPASDALVDAALKAAGFIEERGVFFSLCVLNPASLIGRILAHPAHRLPTEWQARVRLDLPAGNSPVAPQSQVLLEIASGQATTHDITHGGAQPADWGCRLDYGTLTELVFGRITFEEARAAQRLAIDDGHVKNAARLFAALRLNAPWYTPLSDAF